MKVFLQFETIFPLTDIQVGGRTYNQTQLYELNGMQVPVHKYFDVREEKVTVGFLRWSDEARRLYMQMWLTPEDVNFFEKDILAGTLVPMNINLAPDTLPDEVGKAYDNLATDRYIEGLKDGD